MILPFYFPATLILRFAGPERAKKSSGANVLRLIRIRLRAFDRSAPIAVNQEKGFLPSHQFEELGLEISFLGPFRGNQIVQDARE